MNDKQAKAVSEEFGHQRPVILSIAIEERPSVGPNPPDYIDYRDPGTWGFVKIFATANVLVPLGQGKAFDVRRISTPFSEDVPDNPRTKQRVHYEQVQELNELLKAQNVYVPADKAF